MPDPVAAFVTSLEPLLDATQRREVHSSPLVRLDDPGHLARYLVQRGWLTSFQAQCLIRGRAIDLAFGPYRLIEPLGEGGTAKVFKAYHHATRHVVALKLIRPDRLTSSPTALRRFQREIQLVAALDHPHIVLAHEAGQIGDVPYLAMELVEGADLRQLVKTAGPLPAPVACDLIRQAALGLQYAHEHGLIHRDIKPANLVRTAAGVVKILDFGLARLHDDRDVLTRDGAMLGSPEYLAPEQSLDTHGVDARADLYALGATFYYLLTGRPPFRSESLTQLLIMIRSQEPAPLDTFRADVPPTVQDIIRRLLAKDPADRYQSAGELVTALTAEPIPLAELVEPPPAPLPQRRSRRPLLAIAFAGIAAGAALAYSYWPPAASPPVAALPGPRPAPPVPTREEIPEPAAPVASSAVPAQEDIPSNPTIRVATAKRLAPRSSIVEPVPPLAPELAPWPQLLAAPEPAMPTRPAPPSPEQIAAADRLIREAYADGFSKKSAVDVLAFAAQLRDVALKTEDNPPARYVLLRQASDLAGQANDWRLAARCLDDLEQFFDVRARDLKLVLVRKASQETHPLPSVWRGITQLALEQLDDCIEADHYPQAQQFLEIAEAAARKGSSGSLAARVQHRRQDLAEIIAEFEPLRSLPQQLTAAPLDAAINLKWGRFQATCKGHWGLALPRLALGGDDPLAELARRDLADPDGVQQRLDLGHGWWSMALQRRGLARQHLLVRARHWYRLAMGDLTGFNLSLVEKRLKDIDRGQPDVEADPAADPFVVQVGAGRSAFRQGRCADAVQAFLNALELRPNDPQTQQQLRECRYQQALARGLGFRHQGQTAAAAQAFQAALTHKPNDAAARQLLGGQP